MQSGEVELRKVFEEVTKKNVQTCIDYSKSTRNLLRELEEKVSLLENLLRQKDKRIDLLANQLVSLQQRVYSGGT